MPEQNPLPCELSGPLWSLDLCNTLSTEHSGIRNAYSSFTSRYNGSVVMKRNTVWCPWPSSTVPSGWRCALDESLLASLLPFNKTALPASSKSSQRRSDTKVFQCSEANQIDLTKNKCLAMFLQEVRWLRSKCMWYMKVVSTLEQEEGKDLASKPRLHIAES